MLRQRHEQLRFRRPQIRVHDIGRNANNGERLLA